MNLKISEIINKKLYYLILALFIIESLSFLSYLFPFLREAIFFIIVLATIILASKNLKYALYIIIIELIIGSHGYIFFSESLGFNISIRMALWSVVMIIWFVKYIIFLKNYLQTPVKQRKKLSISSFFVYFPAYLVLTLFILIAAVKGLILSDNLKVWFGDFNAWLYFLILLPFIHVFKKNNYQKLIKDLTIIFLAGTTWLALKTLILLFFFSHNLAIIEPLYAWSREYLLAEITALPSGFYRIFLQSHIYNLMLFIIALFSFNDLKKVNKKQYYLLITIFALSLAAILLSLSRSFWVGLVLALLIWFIYLFKNYKKKDYYQQLSKLLLIILGAVFLIVAIINIPMLGYKGDFNAGKTFKERANLKNSEEAAISSRWSLLAPMSQEILKSPIIGHGFGKEITYISSDPRVLENNSSGEYTSSAFEWGWLSIWLKMGFLGLLAYLWLFYRIIKDAFISNYNKVYIWALGLSLLTLMIVNFFTPYLNHPLGIIYLLIVSLIVSSYKLNCLKK
jgi:hypothetical protein